ncbi:MAG: chromosomal replication initiator protein DnaA [Clostridia bacterium]|nr:chromosomal replication initiator protein DnaA [Clostridiales bacterium]MDD7165164.1 chromosomal replication initiator protein DnaA [Clostridia bacterium]MDY2901512.1 chromosomal replication initiator protein DnaA [Christensenellaceae bacterium]
MENYELIWERALKHLKVSVSTIAYSTYIEQLKPVDLIGSKLILSTKSELFASEVAKRLVDKIREALKLAGTGVTDIKLYVEGSNEDYLARKGVAPVQSEIDSTPINPKYTFDTFVVGSSNRYLYAAAKAVAENPADSYNPLFIYGGAGLGKTHIMHAIANYIKQNNPLKNVLYATCEKFTSDLITTIRQGKAYSQEGMDFRNKYRNVDVLIIDDVQFLAKKQSTQEEFFHTFNELYSQNKQIVLSADCHPKEIELLSDRLKTRFEGGLMAQVLPPDIETKIAILQKKAELRKYILSLDVALYLAEISDNDVRSLEGMLNKVIFASMLHEEPITIELAKEALNESAPSGGEKEVLTTDSIIDAVCNFYKIQRSDLLGKKKTKEVVEPRQICAYLMTELLSIPLVTIGQALGGRDHTTVIHARDKISELIKENTRVDTEIKDLKNMILKK